MSRWRLISALLATAAGSLLSFCAITVQAQKIPKRCLPHPTTTHAPKTFIDQVALDHTLFPPGLTQKQLHNRLKTSALDAGSHWRAQVTNAAKEAWQDAGFFQAVATVKAQFISESAEARHVALSVHVDSGPRYRLQRIRIHSVNPSGKLLFSEQKLRKMIPLHYGEVLDAGKIREGLKAIQRYYGTRGYIDMTATPGFHIHRRTDRISLYIFIDQRRQYRVGKMTILGLNRSMEGLLKSKLSPGDIFDWNRVLAFYKSQQPVLPPGASPQDDQVYRVPKTGKVDVWLDFRACPQPGQAHSAADPR